MSPNSPPFASAVRRSVRPLIAAVALVASLAGCGSGAVNSGPLFPVTGQVLLPDGKPLAGGTIYFYPKESGPTAAGEIGSDGKFSLKTVDGRDGAPAGEYKIRVVPGSKYISKKTNRIDPTLVPFSAKYMDEDGDTGLTATVKPEPTTVPTFKLEPAKSAAPPRGRD
jgi:predicted small lipoprotein YifL